MRVCLYTSRDHDEPFGVYPLGCGYVAAYAEAFSAVPDLQLRVVDSIDEAMNFRPNVVGVGSVSQVIGDAITFAQQCKSRLNCITVLGGYHVTSLPQSLPASFDVGIIGEGEATFCELLDLISRRGLDERSLETVPGLCFRAGGDMRVTNSRPLIEDIDTLPPPWRPLRSADEAPVFTSRGCPYRCTFCASHGFWGDKYRLRSAESVVDEIASVVDSRSPKEVVILDDLWMARKPRFREIVDRLVARGIPNRVTFRGFCRSNLVYEDDILLLKRLNYRLVRFGAETGSEALLRRLKGKGISVADHQRVIDLCHKHDMPCAASFIFGIPGETKADLLATKAFLNRNRDRLSVSGFYFFNPIPGTILWEDIRRSGRDLEATFFHRLQMDMTKLSFDWEKILYLNEHNVPLRWFRRFVEGIRDEYVFSRPRARSWARRLMGRLLGNRVTHGAARDAVR